MTLELYPTFLTLVRFFDNGSDRTDEVYKQEKITYETPMTDEGMTGNTSSSFSSSCHALPPLPPLHLLTTTSVSPLHSSPLASIPFPATSSKSILLHTKSPTNHTTTDSLCLDTNCVQEEKNAKQVALWNAM